MTESNARPNWQWDETAKISTDYCDETQAQNYDALHVRPDRTHAEYEEILDSMNPQPDWCLMDIGCGTGTFAMAAARRCEHVYAVDISQAMLEVAAVKARDAGVSNITFLQGGFLTYEHGGGAVDAITSQLVLHHLPDMWKQIALGRMAEMLKPAGVLYLRDVVFQFEHDRHAEVFDKWVDEVAELFGQACMASQAESHIRREFSTFGWIMEGLLKRAGFDVEQADYSRRLAEYFCRKI
ncbi:MAG: class I SAM-dependent methyltransferase [Phycisphaerae bacterium]|jgi:ubiquinone/menaquinone biosynthesis C-methylase UbiE|nr:class I SAM-dependent methyltransferase [Phycisphaerae bacterium]